jgi:hypothetical protein
VLARNSPTILTGVSVAGLFTTVGLAIGATPKALAILEEPDNYHRKGYDKYDAKLVDKLKIIKLTWRCYVPTALMGGFTIACIIGANSINVRRNAALASIYSLTEAALKEYQTKVIEIIGEAKAKKIKDNIDEDTIRKNPVNDREVIITGRGDMLCYETISGRYFKGDIENIRRVQNEINKDLLNDMFISMNDVYEQLGLSYTKIGDDLGWDVNNGLIEFRFSSQLSEDGVPCLVIDYQDKPRYNYRSY